MPKDPASIPFALVVEEVRYDFDESPRYADDFVRDLTKLMIIAKMNAAARNATSKNFFLRLVSQIEGCEAYVVKYGQPLLYARYRDMEFTDQKVTSQFVRAKGHVIDVTMESVFGEFVKRFDSLASMSESKVRWGVTSKKEDRPDPLFVLLDSFIAAVGRLSLLDPTSPDSLAGKRFGIRNASIARKSLQLEFLIEGQLNILELNPAKRRKDDSVKLLFAKSETANAIVALMKQT
ncbi:MAG TPA: hypothetical protein VIE86_00405 [Nitrososphaera sp.]|jgi:hypothetical protein